jgi:hypothetical protein
MMRTFFDRRGASWRGVALLTVAGLVLAACGTSVPSTSAITAPASPTPGPTAAASPTPIPTAAPSASTATVPVALQASWTGAPRVISGLGSTAVLPVLTFDGRSIWVRLDLSPSLTLVSSATASGPGTLSLTLAGGSGGCAVGDVGTYAWSLAPGGAALTLTATSDACAARATAFAGTWTRSACRNTQDLCLGSVPAGTYVSTFFDIRDDSAAVPPRGAYGQLRYTLPAGWANGEDFPTSFTLMPAADYAGPVGVPDGSAAHTIFVFARPAAQLDTTSCATKVAPGVGQTPAALAAWVTSRPGILATRPAPITIGGDPGLMLDLRLRPSWTKKACPADPSPTALMLVDAGAAADSWNWGIGPAERQRLILVDIGGGRTVAIFIDDTSTPSRFTELVAQAMPIVATFTFPQ